MIRRVKSEKRELNVNTLVMRKILKRLLFA